MTPTQQWNYVTRKPVVMPVFRDTGAVERRNPLPRGIYWLDVFGQSQVIEFSNWLDANRGIVELITEERYPNETPLRHWYLFKVTGGKSGDFLPQWDGPGFPTIAEPGVKTSDDTATKPDIDNAGFFDLLGLNVTPGIAGTFKTGLLVVGGLGATYIGYKLFVKGA